MRMSILVQGQRGERTYIDVYGLNVPATTVRSCLKRALTGILQTFVSPVGIADMCVASSIYFYRGKAYQLTGDVEHAIRDYTRAIELGPVFTVIYYSRGIAYAESGDYEQAIRDLERYLELTPDAPDREDVLNVIDDLNFKLSQ